jgi:hypothetical protein
MYSSLYWNYSSEIESNALSCIMCFTSNLNREKNKYVDEKEFRMEIGNGRLSDIFVCQFVNLNLEIIKNEM